MIVTTSSPPATSEPATRAPTPAQCATLALATVATGLAAGFFYAYHVSVTRGLAIVGDRAYVETMQAINATVRNGQFALSFFGALVLGAAALALRLGQRRSLATWLVGAGFALYLVAFAVTMGVNVPLNEDLAATADLATLPAGDLAATRAGYEPGWNRFNGVRTLAATASFAALVAALLADRRPPRPVRSEP